MAKTEQQRLKLLYLYRILMEQTDDQHPLTVAQLIQELEKYGVQAERKSIYQDLSALQSFGLDLISRAGRCPGWFVGNRLFELAELKLLVDAVQSSRFLTEKKSHSLIKKLESLCSKHSAHQLNRQIFVDGRVKTMNESIYYNVDELHTAISAHRTVKFRYFDYNMEKKRVFRQEGRRYVVCPFGLIYNDGNYYLVAYDTDLHSMRHYRVDKMAELSTLGYPFQGEEDYPDFNLATYGQRHFGMFSGELCTVLLRCDAHMSNVIIDRFGRDIILVPQGEDAFTVQIPVVLSPQFFGWLFALGDGVQLVSPPSAVRGYRAQLSHTLTQYESFQACTF